MNFILLFALIGLIIIGVVRALQQSRPKERRPQREPFLGNEPIEVLAVEPEPKVTAVTAQTEHPPRPSNAEYSVEQSHDVDPPEPLDSDLDYVETVDTPQSQPTPAPPPPLKVTDLIIISLAAELKQPYRGYELLQALLTSGLRYSKKGLFHRYEDLAGRGDILFNLVSSTEPGTFDLPKMGSFTTTGLTLFMQIPTVKNPRQVFELMLSTANELAEDLGGHLLDDKRQPLTHEQIALWRSSIP